MYSRILFLCAAALAIAFFIQAGFAAPPTSRCGRWYNDHGKMVQDFSKESCDPQAQREANAQAYRSQQCELYRQNYPHMLARAQGRGDGDEPPPNAGQRAEAQRELNGARQWAARNCPAPK
jgi:hypothetical protein